MKYFFSFFFFLFFFLPLVSAIGISPPQYEINYAPGGQETFVFRVVNNGGQDMIASTQPTGELAPYVTLEKNDVFVPAGGSAELVFHLTFPEELPTPGVNYIKFFVVEEAQDGMIGSRTGVVGRIVVNVPFPGRYAKIDQFAVGGDLRGVNEGSDATAVLSIINLGKEDLLNNVMEIVLSSPDGLNTTLVSEKVDIIVGGKLAQEVVLPTKDFPPGMYSSTLNYYYDDIVRSKRSDFRIGNLDIELMNFTKEIPLGGIQPFELEMKNLWKGAVSVDAQLLLAGKTLTTPRISFSEFRTKKGRVFIDTDELGLGEHTAVVKFVISEESTGRTNENEQEITFMIIDPDAGRNFFSDFELKHYTLLAIAIIILINGFLIFKVMKKK